MAGEREFFCLNVLFVINLIGIDFMNMSQQDVDAYLWSLPRIVAKELGIKDFDFLNSEELEEEIFKAKSEAFVKLDEFIKVYKEWYQFQVEKSEDMENGRLSATDYDASMVLIKKRDDARQLLIKTVRR